MRRDARAHVTSDCHLAYAGLSPVNMAAATSRTVAGGCFDLASHRKSSSPLPFLAHRPQDSAEGPKCTCLAALRCIGRRELKTSHESGSWAQGRRRLRARSYVKALRLSPLYFLPVPPPAAFRRPFRQLCRILCRLRQRSSAGHFFPMRRRRTLEAGKKGGALPWHPAAHIRNTQRKITQTFLPLTRASTIIRTL